jgi:hypothetical protein
VELVYPWHGDVGDGFCIGLRAWDEFLGTATKYFSWRAFLVLTIQEERLNIRDML